MANEIQFLATLTIAKNGAQVSFPMNTKTLNMAGNNMVQQPQLVPTAGAALNIGLLSTGIAKLMVKNTSNGFGLSAVTIASGGTGYVVNDLLTLSGGVGSATLNAAVVKVTAVTGGVITAVSINNAGDYSTAPATPNSPTGGTGTGASLNVTFAANNVVIYGDSGYTQAQDTIQAGDFILRSPYNMTLYAKATNGPVYILTVASEP